MRYNIYRGEYPFNDLIGYTEAPEDQPDLALEQAIEQFAEKGRSLLALRRDQEAMYYLHPVVEPVKYAS